MTRGLNLGIKYDLIVEGPWFESPHKIRIDLEDAWFESRHKIRLDFGRFMVRNSAQNTTYIWKVQDSRLGTKCDHPEIPCSLTQPSHANAHTLTYNGPASFPSTFFPIHYAILSSRSTLLRKATIHLTQV